MLLLFHFLLHFLLLLLCHLLPSTASPPHPPLPPVQNSGADATSALSLLVTFFDNEQVRARVLACECLSSNCMHFYSFLGPYINSCGRTDA